MWGRADETMPNEYVKTILAQIEEAQPTKKRPISWLDSLQVIHAIKLRNHVRRFRQEGLPYDKAPADDAPLEEWYHYSQSKEFCED